MLGESPGLTIPVDIPPFHFQPRWLPVDWHRFSAIDVERVAREVDLATLRDHVTTVTFCNLDGERCPHCGQPADPVLLKVLRMAQLSVEYLLHCQESLGTSLALHTQRLEDARAELACTQQQAAELVAQLRVAKEESRRWKKLLATQQVLLQASPSAYCQCHICNKAFMNDSFLQAHVQRRHTEATRAERQKRKQVELMEDEVEELKGKLREMQQQLEAEREAGKMRGEQETERARQREEEGRRDFERWKEEERTKLHKELHGLKQFFLTAFQDMASRNSAMEGKLQELQAREAEVSNLGMLRDDDTEEAPWQIPRPAELQGEQERMAVQLTKENKTLHATPSQGRVHQQRDALGSWPKITKAQEKIHKKPVGRNKDAPDVPDHMEGKAPQLTLCRYGLLKLKLLSASKPEVTQEVTKAVAVEESSAPTFTPDGEEAAWGGKQRLLEALRRNPNLLKQFRLILEAALEEKLESMGVKKVVKGISTQTYKSLQGLVRLQQQQKAEKFPGLLHLRDELVQAVMRKVRRCKKPSSALPRQLSVTPGTATCTTVRLLERHLEAVARRPPGRVKPLSALSSASPKTSQPTKKFQLAGDSSDLETSSLEDLAEPPRASGC